MFVRSNKNKTILDSDIQDELGKLLSASKLHSVQKATLSLISGLAAPQPLTVSLCGPPLQTQSLLTQLCSLPHRVRGPSGG